MAVRWPEGHMLVLLDLPTLVTYWFLQVFGLVWPIVDASDVRFLAIGLLTWAVLGALLALVYRSFRSRLGARDRESS
jgi:hypothetical protein